MRSRTARVMTTLMRNGRDRRSGKPVKCHATLERVLLFGTRSADYIRASSHNGCIATEVILQAKQAEYMAAPERFAEMPDFSLAPRAPSIHGTSRTNELSRGMVASLIGRPGSSTFRLSSTAGRHQALAYLVIPGMMASRRRCRMTICSRNTRRTMSIGSTRTAKSPGGSRQAP